MGDGGTGNPCNPPFLSWFAAFPYGMTGQYFRRVLRVTRVGIRENRPAAGAKAPLVEGRKRLRQWVDILAK